MPFSAPHTPLVSVEADPLPSLTLLTTGEIRGMDGVKYSTVCMSPNCERARQGKRLKMETQGKNYAKHVTCGTRLRNSAVHSRSLHGWSYS